MFSNNLFFHVCVLLWEPFKKHWVQVFSRDYFCCCSTVIASQSHYNEWTSYLRFLPFCHLQIPLQLFSCSVFAYDKDLSLWRTILECNFLHHMYSFPDFSLPHWLKAQLQSTNANMPHSFPSPDCWASNLSFFITF